MNDAAVTTYYQTPEYRSAYIRLLREMVGLSHSSLQHADMTKTRIAGDDQAVSSLVSVMEEFVHPFQGPLDLQSISNARLATAEIAHDLARAKDIGEETYQTSQG